MASKMTKCEGVNVYSPVSFTFDCFLRKVIE